MRNESAEDFLMLLKEWEKLCQSFSLVGGGDSQLRVDPTSIEEDEGEADNDDDNDGLDEEIFEVDKVLSICYGDPKEIKKRGLYLKVFNLDSRSKDTLILVIESYARVCLLYHRFPEKRKASLRC